MEARALAAKWFYACKADGAQALTCRVCLVAANRASSERWCLFLVGSIHKTVRQCKTVQINVREAPTLKEVFV